MLLGLAGLTAAGPIDPACEPAARIDLSARTLQRENLGTTSRVTVELSVRAHVELPPVRVKGSLNDGPDSEEVFGIPERVLELGAGRIRRILYTFELEQGRAHHLLFSADAGGTRSTAYLRVNLDPELEPEILGDVLQYRARMGAAAGP